MIKPMREKLKFLYKKVVILIFYKIYSKPKLLRQNQIDDSEHQFEIKLNNNLYKIFQLVDGSIYTDSNDTTAYITKNKNLSNASMQYAKFDKINSFNRSISKNETLKIGTPKIKTKIKGSILSLLSGGASKDNFTHWFTDVIPRLKIFQEKFNRKTISKYYVPSIKYKFQQDSLKFLGIKNNQILSSEKYKHITATNIYATSHPCDHHPTKIKKWSLDFIKKIYFVKNSKKKYKNIFIDRDQINLVDFNNLKKYKDYRVLLNEIEIKKFLASQGFKIIKPENYSFLEQVKIFSNANCVVGMYGAAMMMIAFCKRNTNILEIKPFKGGNEFKNISKLLKLKHKQINIKPIFKSSTPQNGLLICSIKKIKKELNLKNL
jgi:hypothetical protein